MTDVLCAKLLPLLAQLADEAETPEDFRDQLAMLALEAERTPAPAPAADRANGQRIRDARKALGLSQRDAAVLLGTSASAVCHWEQGKAPCDADLVIAALQGDLRAKLPRRFTRPANRKEADAE